MAGDDLEVSGGFDELHTFYSDDVATHRNSDSSQDQDDPNER